MGITLLIIFSVAMVVSAIGWKKFIYFISIGYGYSIMAIGMAMMIMHYDIMLWSDFVLTALLMIYGFRLATYLLVRELKSKGYREILNANTKQHYPFVKTLIIWISCALLYLCQTSPLIFGVVNGRESDLWACIGISVMIIGILLEALADRQKSNAKKLNPDRFVDNGLYRIVRCPNYFGEVLVWTGMVLSGIGSYDTWWQWVIALLGYVGIVYIMFSGARRLELRQEKAYGNDPEYRMYVNNTPILLPFVPIYSVKKYSWLKG